MRSKPLNPNSMSLIMESFRKFIDEHDDKNFDSDKVQLHLFEGKSKSPTSQQSFGELLSEYKDNKIDEEVLFERWHRSIDYEYNELLNEGIADTLRAPVKAFANISLLVKAKELARQKVSKYAAKLFAGFAKIMQSIIGKLAAMEKLIFSTATSKGSSTAKTSKILKVYQTVVKIVGSAAKKIGTIAMSITKGVFKFFSHPVVKAIIIIILLSIVVIGIFKASIFVGALAGAPLWAINRLGRKGAIAFYHMIPTGAAVAEASININEVIDMEELADLAASIEDLPDFHDDSGVLGKAVESIAADIGVGTEMDTETFALSYANIDHAGVQNAIDAGADGSEALAAGIDEGYFGFMKTSDESLNADLEAIRVLQQALASEEGMLELGRLVSVSNEADELLTKTIKTAIAVAQKTCDADPVMCEASEVLAQEFQTLNTTLISSEMVDTSSAIIQNGEVAGEWQKTYQVTQAFSKVTVGSNPMADAAASAVRGAGDAAKYTAQIGNNS